MRRATPVLNVLVHVTKPFPAMLIELVWLIAFFKETHVRIQIIYHMISINLVSFVYA